MHENLDRMNLKAYISCLIFSHFQQISTTNSDAQEVYQCYYIKIVIIYIFISGNHFISEGTKITPDDKGGGTTREKFKAQSIFPFSPLPLPLPLSLYQANDSEDGPLSGCWSLSRTVRQTSLTMLATPSSTRKVNFFTFPQKSL